MKPLLRGLATSATAIPILFAAACAIDPRQGYVLAAALSPSLLGTCLLLELWLQDVPPPPLRVAIVKGRS